MKKSSPSTGGRGRARKSQSKSQTGSNPFAANFLSEERPIRATKFSSVLPSIIAKYGVGRKLSIERFQTAWSTALERVFGAVDPDAYDAETFTFDKLSLFKKYARVASYRNGTLRIEVASGLLSQELQFNAQELLREIRALLPDETLTSIKIVVR